MRYLRVIGWLTLSVISISLWLSLKLLGAVAWVIAQLL